MRGGSQNLQYLSVFLEKPKLEIMFSVMLAFDKSDAMRLIMRNSYFESITHHNAI
jgi:hypothetical protein